MSILIASVIGDSFLSYKPSLQLICQASPSRALLLHHIMHKDMEERAIVIRVA